MSQKMHNVLKQIFESMSFYCAIFSFGVMVDFIFYLRSAFKTLIFEPKNLIQKRKPVLPGNQLARGIQSKSMKGLGADPPGRGVLGDAP